MRQKKFKNLNILKQITPQTQDEDIIIYKPSSGRDSGNNVIEYSGFITSFRLMVDIKSVPELIIPNRLASDTDEQRQAKERQAVLECPKKGMELLLKSGDNSPVLAAELLLFNKYPYYWVELIKYLSGNDTFECSFDTTVIFRMFNAGNGVLEGSDRISVIGSVIEDSGINTSDNLNISVSGTSSNNASTGGGSEIGNNNDIGN